MKKKYIAVMIVLLLVIGMLVLKIISDDSNTPGKLIQDDINRFQEKQEDELKSIKEEDFLGWWNNKANLSVKVEKDKIIYYNATIFGRVSDNEIEYKLSTYTKKDGTGIFGTYVEEGVPECYVKISKKDDSFFIEAGQGGFIEKNEYEYMGSASDSRVLYFLSPAEKYIDNINIENINFKDGKMYRGNEIVMEKVNGKVKIENREYQRMNILDE